MSGTDITGAVDCTVKEDLTAQFRYTGSGTAPDHLDLLVTSSLDACAEIDYYDFSSGWGAAPDAGTLSAQASASDGLGASVTINGGAAGPSERTLTGQHLVRVTTAGGVATVHVPAQVSVSSVNMVPSAGGSSDTYFQTSAGATATPTNLDVTAAINVGGNGGATPDGNGGYAILIGQHCAPTVNVSGLPLGYNVTAWQWSVTGTTFQSWTVSSDSSHTTEVDGPGDLTLANPGWYWNEIGSGVSKPETMSCTATVTPPAGQGSAFTVSASQQVSVWTPTWAARGVGGEMLVGTAEPHSNGTDEWLYAAPVPDSNEPGGMSWYASVAAPMNAPVTFGTGQLELVQLAIPDLGYTDFREVEHPWSENGLGGLDTLYPYGWASTPQPDYTANDSPGINLTATGAVSAYVADQFEDYLMYKPLGSSQYVTVGHFVWSTDGYAVIPLTNNWADYGQFNSAGIVVPSDSGIPFAPYNTFPSWTQNDRDVNATFN